MSVLKSQTTPPEIKDKNIKEILSLLEIENVPYSTEDRDGETIYFVEDVRHLDFITEEFTDMYKWTEYGELLNKQEVDEYIKSHPMYLLIKGNTKGCKIEYSVSNYSEESIKDEFMYGNNVSVHSTLKEGVMFNSVYTVNGDDLIGPMFYVFKTGSIQLIIKEDLKQSVK